MAANLDLGSKNVINLTNPTAAQQAVTKNYIDTTKPYYILLFMCRPIILMSGLGQLQYQKLRNHALRCIL